jgi:hypothetical protein
MGNLDKYYDEENNEWILSLNCLGIPFFAYFDSEKDRDWTYDYLTKRPGFVANPAYNA